MLGAPPGRPRTAAAPLCAVGLAASLLSTGLTAALAPAPAEAATTDLLVSEYVEGSGGTKALEIWNGTGAAVSLTGYTVDVYFNGATTAATSVALTGTVAAGDVHVLAASASSSAVLAAADQTTSASLWNGDDAVVLRRGSTVVDSLGQVGVDPGTQWGTDPAATADNTMRRKSTVGAGDTVTTDAFSPATQWDGYAVDTVSGLGSHTGPASGSGACALTPTAVGAVQGSGTSSPLAGSKVVVRGTVTANLAGMDGFAVQDAGDGSTATSDGLFVYVPASNATFRAAAQALTAGQVVAVRGTVSEFNTLTQLDTVDLLDVCGSAAVPSPTTYTLPEPADGDLERVEGMLTTLTGSGGLTVQQNYFLGRYGQLTLGSGGRRMQPTNQYDAGSASAVSLADANRRAMVVLDDARSAQNPNPVPFMAGDRRRAGDTVTSVTGIVDFGPVSSTTTVRDYRLQVTQTPAFTAANSRTTAPAAVGGNLKVASFNVLNYFTTLTSQNASARGADTAAERDRQVAKLVAAMSAIDADVFGLMEIENLPGTNAVQSLTDALNAKVGSTRFAALIETGTNTGGDAIKTAMIYQPAKVTPVGSALRDNAAINDRPTLAQAYRVNSTGGVTSVVVNHFKSKGSCPASGADADQGDGQGCWNAKRTQQAQQLLTFLGQVRTASGDPDALVIGDLNSYGQEDPIQVLTSGGLTNQVAARVGSGAYSYVFDGLAGYLDHALTTATASAQVTGVTEWHVNADEPSVIDYNTEFKPTPDLYSATPYRSSDHDPVVVGMTVT